MDDSKNDFKIHGFAGYARLWFVIFWNTCFALSLVFASFAVCALYFALLSLFVRTLRLVCA